MCLKYRKKKLKAYLENEVSEPPMYFENPKAPSYTLQHPQNKFHKNCMRNGDFNGPQSQSFQSGELKTDELEPLK